VADCLLICPRTESRDQDRPAVFAGSAASGFNVNISLTVLFRVGGSDVGESRAVSSEDNIKKYTKP
jgi:hypothetical protein